LNTGSFSFKARNIRFISLIVKKISQINFNDHDNTSVINLYRAWNTHL
jgi:hypothetical protein